jgi:hypothetical protein
MPHWSSGGSSDEVVPNQEGERFQTLKCGRQRESLPHFIFCYKLSRRNRLRVGLPVKFLRLLYIVII